MKTNYLFIALGIAALVGCDSVEKTNFEPIHEIPLMESIDLTAGEASVNGGMNDFAFNLFNEVAAFELDKNAGSNVCISPLSASLALAMLANTGDDNTTAEVAKMLGFEDPATLNTTVNKLIRYLPSKKSGAGLELANAVWYNNIYVAAQSYVDNMARTFYAETAGADFGDPASLEVINGWCNEKSHGMIPSVISELNKNKVFLLINALYFSGKWKEPFDKSATGKRVFVGVGGDSSVDMMHSEGVGDYLENELAEAISLPFDGSTRLVALLPKDGHTASGLARTFTAADFRDLKTDPSVSLLLDLPRFAANSNYDEQLIDILCAMGLSLTTYPDKMGIDMETEIKAIQKNSMKIDEEGAVLSSVTVIEGEVMAPPPSPNVKRLTFNRPFLFFVENTATGTILMAGLINNL